MDPLSHLVDAFRCLPGVGPKSAQRMVFYLLQHQRQRGLNLAACLNRAMQSISNCQRCNNFTAEELCIICQKDRDPNIICVVEGPADVIALEQSTAYQGYYYVLMGRISPIDGIGPKDIGLERLKEQVIKHQINEVILALSPSIEGQTTIHFIREMLHPHVNRITQLAQGIPSGVDVACLDGNTIGSALRNREILKDY